MASEHSQTEKAFDPDSQQLGAVYAKALLGMADKNGSVDSVMEQLESFAEALQQLPQLRQTLESPRVSGADKAALVEKAVGGKGSREFVNFLKVVVGKGRAKALPAIARAARDLVDERSGRVRATMVTAQEVSGSVHQAVARRMEEVLGKQVVITPTVDPEIIGGVVVRVGDTVYDGSVRNQLNQVRSAAISRANQEIRDSLDRFAPGA